MLVSVITSWRCMAALVLALSIVLSGFGIPTDRTVAQPSKTINLQIIVDQSGSMAAATDTGVLRIDAAKQVLTEVIDQIPDASASSGISRLRPSRYYQLEGQAESCASTELLVPMQGVDKATLTAEVDSLEPVGWTPLGLALEEAADDFTQEASDDVVNAVIMVTDGLETCGADPATVAAQLKDSPAEITTHVIGFGTLPEELTILEASQKPAEANFWSQATPAS